jgi:hypothetical protein
MAEARAKRFKAPKKCCGDCKEIVIKELDGKDEIAAAVEVDKRLGQPGFRSDNIAAIMKLERQEKIRKSIAAVDGVAVKPGEVFEGYDAFHAPTKLWIALCYEQVNGLEDDDLKKSLATAEEVDLAHPTSGGAATGEPAGG